MGLRSYIILLFSLGFSFTVRAEDLAQVYALAIKQDPTLQAAYSQLQANRQSLPQALAQMAPSLSANYVTTGNEQSTAFPSQIVFAGGYNTKSYGLTLNQPIFHPEMWAQFEQSRHVVKAAIATYLSATQDLILRVANQYFSILAAIDDFDFAASQRKAFAREYEQAKQRFDVGIIAITDVESAKAKYDRAVATEISTNNTVSDQYEKLREITGIKINQIALFPIAKRLPLARPVPDSQEAWVENAHLQNLNVIAAKENAKQQKAIIGSQVAGHFPKVDVQGNLQRNKQSPPFNDFFYDRSISLNIAVPLFSGGGVVFRTLEAQARYDESMQKLEGERRLADSQTRQAFRGVLTAISSVTALEQAVISNESNLKSTKAAYEVGTRTIVDVLNAESDLLAARRDHAKARYQYLMEGLKLKRAAGNLTSDDLFMINELIKP